MRRGLAFATFGLLLVVFSIGCGGSKIKTHPVTGKVEIKDGDVAILQGSHVELTAPEAERRASGVIAGDGTYALKTMHGGEFLDGVPEGEYQVRIILGDESDENVPKRKGNPIHPKYLSFETSGLKLSVPSGDYKLSLSRK